MAARGYEFYLQVLIVFLTSELRSLVRDNFSTKFLLKTQLFFIHFRNSKIVQLVPMWKFGSSSRKSPVTVPSSHLETIFVHEISREPAARLSGKLSCNWLIMLVTMATPISSHVEDKNNIFTARDEDMIF